MTEYAPTEPQRFPRQAYAFNSQVVQNWDTPNMPAQEMQSYEPTDSSNSVNNWVMNGNPSYAAQGNAYQTNGIPPGYGASVSEQPSINHINVHRNISNSIGISVNTANLPVGSANVISTDAGKIICVADVRGNISQLNHLAKQTGAMAVIHSGDFGFYENNSLERISDRTLRHLVTYSTIISTQQRNKLLHNSTSPEELRRTIKESPTPLLSEFPLFMKGEKTLDVPVYTVWGACEDVTVLEKFRMGHYKVNNLYILDEANTYSIDVGGVSLRLFGLGGAVVQHKLFDNGEGISTIAGGHGTMWTTILQIGELVDTAQKHFDPTETRVLVTHASPGREGLLAQLSVVLRADFTISAGLHFRYGISYNEFSVQVDQANFCNKLETSRKSFYEMWESVKSQVEGYIDENQKVLLHNALTVVEKVPSINREREEPSFKNMWNFNLPDAAFGWLLLDIKDGRVSAETKAQGFNFSYRRAPPTHPITGAPQSTQIGAPTSPSPMNLQTRRTQSQWQPSPALVPQPHISAGPSPILVPQRSSSPTQITSPNELNSNSWKQYNESSSPTNEVSTSQKILETNNDTSERDSSKLAGSDTSNSSQEDTITSNTISNNDTANTNLSENIINNNQINGTVDGGGTWADQTQHESNWPKSDINESNQDHINNNTNSEEGSTVPQNRNQYNNRRGNIKSPFSTYVGNLTPPVTEDELRAIFEKADCQIERVRLMFDQQHGGQRSFAYVDFSDAASQEKAILLSGQGVP
ncbi:3630_t:CDS:10 [Funneliformis geosporum]|uniref:3630_t:CDS:1 n=1 Tax=Funneliformis geosporum TaxID=1117311 RepID=A0A9W4WKQ7_9GLOM|nr:3630_t:CDS:10 [Funneliformis geosporum]